ncbi:MAG: type 2 lantipeptide synthetase LanM family protein [Caldilineaceae bacterium]|nr:type 2 lantipeptide synthetase LanM family protein [Caldilineaceae bacterium]
MSAAQTPVSAISLGHAERSPTWWQAQTLHERSASSATPGNADVAARRFQQWRAETPFLDDDAFIAQLQREGTTPAALRNLLGETAAALQQRQAAALPWLATLEQVYGEATHAAPSPTQGSADQPGFYAFVAPLVDWAAAQLRQRLQTVSDAAEPGCFTFDLAEAALRATLAEQLPPLIERTLVLEMHVARLQGLLPGTTSAERFAAFVERLRDQTVALALLEEYPVLARQLVTKVNQTTNAMAEILTRLTADWSTILATFHRGKKPGALVALTIGAGDTHREGRSVAILDFAGGLRLVYKPRSLAVDRHFQELLRWLNQQGATPAFRTLTLLDRGHYGWVEFITAAACTNSAAITRFYQRQGGYLALLYALNAADFHFENLIAAGEDPMLIDLEALFHPDILEYDPTDPGQLAQQALDQSVLSIGMLPQRLQFHADAAPIDISGIGAADRQLTPDKLPVWEGAGTDEMHLTRRHIEFSSSGHRPQLADAAIDVRAQTGAVVSGFTQIYRLLLAHHTALLAPDGPLAPFASAEIRVVARATRTYSLLLQESSHPDLLRNALDRDRLYTRLWKDVQTAPRLARLLAAERRDLHQGDVPIFLTQPGSTDLWDSTGQRLPAFLPASGLTRVQQRLAQLHESDLARQVWYIEAAFATLDSGHHHRTAPHQPLPQANHLEQASNETLQTTARTIGDHLAGLAHRHGAHAVWIGLGLDEQNSWSLAPLTMHLYDGHAGLALFFAYLGKTTGAAQYTELAEAALATTLAQAEPLTDSFSYIGGFSGWGGLIYTLAQLGQLWQRPALWTKAVAFADVAARYVAQDEQLDVIGGAAGCIGATAALYQCTQEPRLLALIDQCAAHLVARAQPMPTGVGWVVPNMGGRALAGFSHGAAGIAWALTMAAELCAQPAYHQVATAALRYERSLFAPAAANWRDLRSEANSPAQADTEQFMHAWCHGAPGIGLARLAMATRQADPLFTTEIAYALQSTAAGGFGHGHCLCHGDLGNVELFVKAAEVLNQEKWLSAARRQAGRVLAEQTGAGWRCGVPRAIETPGLMVGLAGIGYALLRLAHPQAVPSLLLLEGPRSMKEQ